MSKDRDSDDEIGTHGIVRAGLATVLVAFGGFGTWAALAPMDSAAIAHGEVKVESYRKAVQHRDGGIVKDILVRDGDQVTAGQPLLLLDDTPLRARWRQLRSTWLDALANKARLTAERDKAGAIDFAAVMPAPDGPGGDDPHIAEVQRAQTNLFQARRKMLDGQVAVLHRRIEQSDREIQSLTVEQGSKERQLALIREEVGTVEGLLRKGLGIKPRLLSLKREAARLEGERDDFSAQIARIRQSIAGTELEIANVEYRHLDQVAQELREVENDIRDLEQQITAADDQLRRTVVRAPQDGIVVNSKIHTRGGVINAGDQVMEVVPRHDRLVVEAQVKPEDIDRVHIGRTAQIRLRTFMRGLTPPAEGKVVRVSADLLRNERQDQSYYLARIELDPASLTRLPGPLEPGMQADVLIATGERTALEYMIEPLAQAMALAFHEK